MPQFIDLLIENNDLVLNIASEPQLISDRASIAQDIKHAIREKWFTRDNDWRTESRTTSALNSRTDVISGRR
ncbi:DUF2590 family protein [Zooshikella ganghwensis]|uniref:DUF2590 family protein n=1 Tax=Zooshikella ganghwensis TaxID=202772 RepID=UPI0019826B79